MKPFLLALLLVASSCETTQYIPAAVDAKVDSTLRAAGIGPLQAGKIKIAGNVIINTGPGAVQIADNRKAGQRQGSAATGPGSQAIGAPHNADYSWCIYALVSISCLLFGGWFRARIGKIAWLF
jgi:hypothetical protein